MAEVRVAVSKDRLYTMALLLGSQAADFCPPIECECWLKSDCAPRLEGNPVDEECAECWLSFVHRDA
jgi:hypothetical protein